MILCIETATSVCSVALIDRDGLVSQRYSNSQRSHATMLTVFAGELLEEKGITASGLEAVAVSKGPGSYTGLRIGVSTAKGIAYGASIPLIGIETTLAMFHGMIGKVQETAGDGENILLCPMLDAKRMEVYYCLYDLKGEKKKDISAEIITPDSFRDIPAETRILFFGDGAMKCRDTMTRSNVIFEDSFTPDASFMQKPAFHSLDQKRYEDVAYFEPFYLKDFIATVPKKNIMA